MIFAKCLTTSLACFRAFVKNNEEGGGTLSVTRGERAEQTFVQQNMLEF